MASLAVTKTTANFFFYDFRSSSLFQGLNSALPKNSRKVNNPSGTTPYVRTGSISGLSCEASVTYAVSYPTTDDDSPTPADLFLATTYDVQAEVTVNRILSDFGYLDKWILSDLTKLWPFTSYPLLFFFSFLFLRKGRKHGALSLQKPLMIKAY